MSAWNSRLHHEVGSWVEDGIITDAQGKQISAKYPTTHEGRTLRIVSWLGATLVTVGIILWVATNWQNIPDILRVLLLAIVATAAYGAGWQLLEHKYTALGHAALVIGAGTVGGTIFQIANWMHWSADHPLLLGMWLLTLIPIIYAFNSVPVLIEAMIILPFWIGFGINDDTASYGTYVAAFAATGLAIFSMGWLHPTHWHGFRATFRVTGATWLLLLGFVTTFSAQELFYGDYDIIFSWGMLVAGLAALILFPIAMLRAAPKAQPTWNHAVLVLFLLMAATAAFGVGHLPNIMYAVLLILVVLAAVQARDEWVMNLGLLFFVVNVVGRYFEFFFDYQTNASLFFIGGGLLLLGLAFGIEKLRRQLLTGVRDGN